MIRRELDAERSLSRQFGGERFDLQILVHRYLGDYGVVGAAK